jgi:hypothetical protein
MKSDLSHVTMTGQYRMFDGQHCVELEIVNAGSDELVLYESSFQFPTPFLWFVVQAEGSGDRIPVFHPCAVYGGRTIAVPAGGRWSITIPLPCRSAELDAALSRSNVKVRWQYVLEPVDGVEEQTYKGVVLIPRQIG